MSRQEARSAAQLPRLCAYCAMQFHGKEVEGVTHKCDCNCHASSAAYATGETARGAVAHYVEDDLPNQSLCGLMIVRAVTSETAWSLCERCRKVAERRARASERIDCRAGSGLDEVACLVRATRVRGAVLPHRVARVMTAAKSSGADSSKSVKSTALAEDAVEPHPGSAPEPTAARVRCDGGCGYATDEGRIGARCPNCGLGLLVKNEKHG